MLPVRAHVTSQVGEEAILLSPEDARVTMGRNCNIFPKNRILQTSEALSAWGIICLARFEERSRLYLQHSKDDQVWMKGIFTAFAQLEEVKNMEVWASIRKNYLAFCLDFFFKFCLSLDFCSPCAVRKLTCFYIKLKNALLKTRCHNFII